MGNVLSGQMIELADLKLISPLLKTSVAVEVSNEKGVSVNVNLAKQEWVGKYFGWIVGKSAGFGYAANLAIASIFKSVQVMANRIGLPCKVTITSKFEGDSLLSGNKGILSKIGDVQTVVADGYQTIDFEVKPETETEELIGLS